MRTLTTFTAAALALITPVAASAFCGFYVGGADTKLYNNATQVVLMREGTRTVLSMQNNYQGPTSGFAMVVPVPVVLQKENVKTLPRNVFDKIDQLDSPRLVEYWEQDPCGVRPEREEKSRAKTAAPMAIGGSGRAADELGVKIEAQFTVGEYEIVILSAKDSQGLDTWLRQEKYSIPAGAEPFLKPYVEAGSKFFVAKVDPEKVTFKDGMAALSPLRFHYDSTEFSLPVRLGLINSKDAQDLVVHILAKNQRYEVSNYSNVTIPTNLDVDESARGQFSTFYASLFDRTLEKNPKAIVTEYAWAASSCDPCPGPTLDGSDIQTFGGDAIATEGQLPQRPPGPNQGIGKPGGMGRGVGRPGMGMWGAGWVLTRLHARYGKDTLGADLVFKSAPPISGGREVRGQDGLEHGAQPAPFNNFQGRYAVRHPWKGPIACANPVRGIWGGPPPGETGSTQAKAARDLAFAPRQNVQLASFLKSEVPELDMTKKAPVPASSATVDAGTAASGEPEKKGCAGCSTSPASSAAPLGVVGLALLVLRRRKKK
jgi:MYXO-CTERM domain-containing protein